MATGQYIEVPVLQDKASKRAMRKYQGTKSSIIATPYKFLSREDLAAVKTRTWLPEISAAWKLLEPATKAIWKTYAANIHRTNWSLYCQEYCYRKKHSLSYPPLPTELHQMMGLLLSNPSGSGTVSATRYDIAITGQITVRFNFKKTEYSPTGGLPFRVTATAYHFYQGQNLSESQIYNASAGNIDWTQVEFTFGTAGRYYFELIIVFELTDYEADVKIDNFKITDNLGILYEEPWHAKAGKEWIYQIKTRKMGWGFLPGVQYPEIQVVYTGE